MEVTVKLKNIRRSPTKIRPTLFLIKGRNAKKALDILKFTNRGCAAELYKLIKSGIAAAGEREMKEDNLIVKIAKCDQATVMKRHRYGSRGRVVPIIKRNSHLTITLTDEVKTIADKSEKKSAAEATPVGEKPVAKEEVKEAKKEEKKTKDNK